MVFRLRYCFPTNLTKGGRTVTQQQYIIPRKTNILELGRTLGNISEACRKLGVSHTHYYDIIKASRKKGSKSFWRSPGGLPASATGLPLKSSRRCWKDQEHLAPA